MKRYERILEMLHSTAEWRDPNAGRDVVTALQHAQQCATFAYWHNAQDRELVAAAYLHDAARHISPPYHGEVIAEILKDRVRDEVYHALRVHGVLSDELSHGKPLSHQDEPWFNVAHKLAIWDSRSFDPNALDQIQHQLLGYYVEYVVGD